MDSLVIILSIFLVISLGFSIFLFLQSKKPQAENNYSHEINQEIRETIEKIYKQREEDFKTSSKESVEMLLSHLRKELRNLKKK